jgi:hypothetical protein
MRPISPPLRALTTLAALSLAAVACDFDGDGVRRRHDCDDNDPNRFPGAREICDGIDNDCDLAVDERLTRTFYRDADRDLFGTRFGAVEECAAPFGYVEQAGDCDDNDSDVFPGAPERCDGKDNDCDGFIDVDGASGRLYYPDRDGDGYGDRYATRASCAGGTGWAPSADDCDDSRADTHPGATEVCNGIDDDCDGTIDDVPGGC